MTGKLPLNGCDYLMLGFDHELRRRGFAGNSCQIILELGSPISAQTLEERLAALRNRWPVIQARPGGVFRPRWKIRRSPASTIAVRTHTDHPRLRQRFC